jgi:hypothetical protein
MARSAGFHFSGLMLNRSWVLAFALARISGVSTACPVVTTVVASWRVRSLP